MNKLTSQTQTWQVFHSVSLGHGNRKIISLALDPHWFPLCPTYFEEHCIMEYFLGHQDMDISRPSGVCLGFNSFGRVVFNKSLNLCGPQLLHLERVVGRHIQTFMGSSYSLFHFLTNRTPFYFLTNRTPTDCRPWCAHHQWTSITI